MLNNFIYAKTKSLFEEKLANNEILPEAIVFIEDTKEIWNHGTYFGASDVDLDSMMSDTSENGVQNKVIKEYIDLHSRYEQVDNIDAPDFNLPTVVVDSFISSTSTNPVQNKTIKAELDKKLDKNSVDAALSSTSTNPVQNKTLYNIVGDLQPTLQSGVNIKTINGKSILGEGNIVIESSSANDFTTSEKNKLAGIAEGAEVNVQSDWNATSGDAFIKNKPSLATVATSGSYNDLSNKPTIPSAVTESTVSGWGFTKNTGTYSKPSTGIPKSDLASAVQTSLGKADTALQSVPLSASGTRGGIQIGYSSTTKTNLPVKLSSEKAYVTLTKDAVTTALGITPTANTGTVKSITPGTGLTGTSSDSAITGSGTINLKTATTSEIGGIKPAAVRTSSVSSTTGGTTSGRYYGVELDSNGKAFVNVPWVDSNIKVVNNGGNGGSSTSPYTLSPNTLTVFTYPVLKHLYLQFTEGEENAHYMFQFKPYDSSFTLSLPDTVTWYYGTVPTFSAGKIVQISIFNNKAVGGVFE